MRFVLEPLCESFIVLPGQQVEVHAVFDEDTDNRSFTVAPNDGFLVVYAPGEIRGFVDHYVTLDGVRMEPQPGSAEQTRIAPAGNTLPGALAVLRGMGYKVSRQSDGERLFVAERESCVLMAEDVLLLLGLAKLYESRGASWRPSDEEVAAYLELEGNGA